MTPESRHESGDVWDRLQDAPSEPLAALNRPVGSRKAASSTWNRASETHVDTSAPSRRFASTELPAYGESDGHARSRYGRSAPALQAETKPARVGLRVRTRRCGTAPRRRRGRSLQSPRRPRLQPRHPAGRWTSLLLPRRHSPPHCPRHAIAGQGLDLRVCIVHREGRLPDCVSDQRCFGEEGNRRRRVPDDSMGTNRATPEQLGGWRTDGRSGQALPNWTHAPSDQLEAGNRPAADREAS